MRSRVLLVLAACSGGGGHAPGAPANEPPQILSLATNTMQLDERDHLAVTAVVTDPDGVDDLIGGMLVDPASGAAYGAFATSAAEGAYELELAWSDIEAVHAIDTPIAGAPRDFTARFFDQAGDAAEQTLTVTLHCSQSGYALCDGACTDLATDPDNCGACHASLPEGTQCEGGRAACAAGPENTVAACTDGCSNDGDPYIDCDDYDCCDIVACAKGTTCNP